MGCTLSEGTHVYISHCVQIENTCEAKHLSGAIAEMQMFSTPFRFTPARLTRLYFSRVLATDASDNAGALCTTISTPHVQRELLKNVRYSSGVSLESQTSSIYASSKHWTLALAHTWVSESHINDLESEAIYFDSTIARSRKANICRLFFLTDSIVCAGIFTKGRSSTLSVLHYARKTASLFVARDIKLILVHE